jgi:hypothetical protein
MTAGESMRAVRIAARGLCRRRVTFTHVLAGIPVADRDAAGW